MPQEIQTKRDFIVSRYEKTRDLLKSHLDDDLVCRLFPEQQDVDIVDLIFFINFYFSTTEHREGVRELMKMNNITIGDDKFELLFPIVEEFIVFLRDFKKKKQGTL